MISFTDDEIETIKKVLDEWGFEYSLKADPAKVLALCEKLGLIGLHDQRLLWREDPEDRKYGTASDLLDKQRAHNAERDRSQ
jgi:hypothetical protein